MKEKVCYEFNVDWKKVDVVLPEEVKKLRDWQIMEYYRVLEEKYKPISLIFAPSDITQFWERAYEAGVNGGIALAETPTEKVKKKKKR